MTDTLRPCEMCGALTVARKHQYVLHEKPRVVCPRCRQQPPGTDTEAELRKAVDAVEHALRVVNGHSTCRRCGGPWWDGSTDVCFACHQKDGPAPVTGHSTTLPPPPMLPAVSRIPPEALAAVERVLAHRAGVVAEVVGQERWRQTTPQHQATKCATHASECLRGVVSDRDTGEHPLAHAAARALLGLALYLQRR